MNTSIFQAALSQNDFKAARNIVSFIVDKAEKQQCCHALCLTAIAEGRISVAREVAPFTGRLLSEAEFRECLKNALKKGLLKEANECKEWLGESWSQFEIGYFKTTAHNQATLSKRHLVEMSLRQGDCEVSITYELR